MDVRALSVALALALVGVAATGSQVSGAGSSPPAPHGEASPVPAYATADPTIVAAGDISCDPTNSLFHHGHGTKTWCRAGDTTSLIERINPDEVLPLGDEQYEDGRLSAFHRSYAIHWGTQLWRSRPVPGNHEYYGSSSASGYFAFFGSHAGPGKRGWYSYDLGAWHLIALNSNCDLIRCRPGSAQYRWLHHDLATHASACTLAYFHHPRFSSGPHGNDSTVALTTPFWRLLYRGGADVILNGHDHIYERFAPMTPMGTRDVATGIREFVVGTGGAEHYWIERVRWQSQVRNARTFGVLRMTLHPGSYAWRFVPIHGASFTDAGSDTCHGVPAA
jgi:hypothetical protein